MEERLGAKLTRSLKIFSVRVLLILSLSIPITAVVAGFMLMATWTFIYILKTNVTNYYLAYVPIPIFGFLIIFIVDGYVKHATQNTIIRKLWHSNKS